MNNDIIILRLTSCFCLSGGDNAIINYTSLVSIRALVDTMQAAVACMKEVIYEVPSASERDKLAVLKKSVDELQLSIRVYNCLINGGIKTIGELVQKTERQLLGMRNFGGKSLIEVKEVLASRRLSLGMNLEGILPAEG